MADSLRELEAVVYRGLRIGVVSDVDNENRIARVYYEDLDMTSDWMGVMINQDYIPDYEGPQATEYEGPAGSDMALFERHRHLLTIKPWMPKLGDQVIVAYLPMKDGEGFILGGLRPWQKQG